MLDRMVRRGALERRRRIARRFGGISRARRQREGAEPREQIGDPLRLRDRFAHRLDQRRFAIRRRLEEAADRESAPECPTSVTVAGCGS